MLLKKSKMIIFWMISMKFKGYTIQLTISVKTDEMGNKNLFREVFLQYSYITIASFEPLGLLMEQRFIPIVDYDHDGLNLVC